MKTCGAGCTGTEPLVESSTGQSYCANCGVVIESQTIRNEIQFSENANGSAGVIGTLVSHDFYSSKSAFGNQYGYRNSREVTLANSRRVIQGIAAGLNLKTDHVDMAQNYYRLALSVKFTQGRPTRNVAASCLYLVCRREETSHILLDFADVLRVNVYIVGAVFLKLCQALHIENLPIVDPCLYIHRYALKMEFGSKIDIVEETANRIIQRMKRDWIHLGRRPIGLCGAALLLAARMHNFSRTMKDVVDNVNVYNQTIQNRLEEFAKTESGGLSLEEFMLVDLERDADPPSFIKARQQAIIAQKTITDAESIAMEMDSVLAIEWIRDKPNRNGTIAPVKRASAAALKPKLDISDDPDNLDDVDDGEIHNMLLTNGEVQVKTQMWTQLNQEWLLKAEEKQKIDELNRANNIDPPKKRQKKKLRMDPNATDKERKKKELEESLQRAKLSRKLNYAAISQLEELDKDLEEGTVFSKDSTAAIGYKTEDGKDMTTAVSAGASTETPSASAVTTVGGGIKRKTMAAEDLDAYSDLDDELLHADDYNESDDEAKKQTQAMQALLGKGPDVDNVGADGTYQFSDDEEAEDFDF